MGERRTALLENRERETGDDETESCDLIHTAAEVELPEASYVLMLRTKIIQTFHQFCLETCLNEWS